MSRSVGRLDANAKTIFVEDRSQVKGPRRRRKTGKKRAESLLAPTFPFWILATFSEIDGKAYVEINTERAADRGIFHAADEQPVLRLYVNDELVLDWPRQDDDG